MTTIKSLERVTQIKTTSEFHKHPFSERVASLTQEELTAMTLESAASKFLWTSLYEDFDESYVRPVYLVTKTGKLRQLKSDSARDKAYIKSSGIIATDEIEHESAVVIFETEEIAYRYIAESVSDYVLYVPSESVELEKAKEIAELKELIAFTERKLETYKESLSKLEEK